MPLDADEAKPDWARLAIIKGAAVYNEKGPLKKWATFRISSDRCRSRRVSRPFARRPITPQMRLDYLVEHILGMPGSY